MNPSENAPSPAPWHDGERRLQTLYGVADRMETIGRRVIRNAMPDQHREFFSALPFVVVGSVDDEGRPWATLLEGPPGFVRSPDARRLEVAQRLSDDDPAGMGFVEGAAVGLLGIELSTRRRNRMNGRLRDLRADGFAVEVEQSFGNCPQYIQRRETPGARAAERQERRPAERLASLDAKARALIETVDTFFVATSVDPDADLARRSVDVSHRGGRPGFVRIDGDRLTIPDFPGNLHFNTLGNLVLNPRAGLAFVDFETGDLLQVSGRTELVLAGPEVERFAGAERLWRLEVEASIRRPAALGLRLHLVEMSKQSLATGSWEPLPQERSVP